MKGKICIVILLVMALTIAISPGVNAASMVIKTGETQVFSVNTSQATNTTWYVDQNAVLVEKSFEYNHTFTYSPNAADIGYHDITFVGQNENGGVSKEWTDIFVGTLFVAKNETIGTINATTNSIVAEPFGNFNLTTFVENVSANFIPKDDYSTMIEYAVSPAFLNLSDTRSGAGETIWLNNGSIYMLPFNTTDKNGTFLISLNNPYAEKSDGQRINVSVTAGQVWVSPRYDIGGAGGKPDFVVNIIDLTILRQHYGEIIPVDVEPPRYDIDKNRIVNIIDLTILKQNYGKTIPTV